MTFNQKLVIGTASIVVMFGLAHAYWTNHKLSEKVSDLNAKVEYSIEEHELTVAKLKETEQALARARSVMEERTAPSTETPKQKNGDATATVAKPEPLAQNPIDTSVRDAAGKSRELKKYLTANPRYGIPELEFCEDADWLAAAKEVDLTSETSIREALSALRKEGKNEFVQHLQTALHKYAEQNNAQLPARLSSLENYFPISIEPAILERYRLVESGAIKDIAAGKAVIEESNVVDDEIDTLFTVGVRGFMVKGMNKQAEAVVEAIGQYAKANRGQIPTEPTQLEPFLDREVDSRTVERMIESFASGQ